MKLFKFLILGNILNVLTTFSTIGGYNIITQKDTSLEFDNLFNSIKYGSKPVDRVEKWSIGDKDFYDKDELYRYLIAKGDIRELQTSSNPNKILKDPANGILDENKIYDLDETNYKQVYRDAFGNVALTKEAALNTYVNSGSIRHRYSYNSKDWFDSPEEAKNDYVYEGGLHKSLYYLIGTRYYNVFNPKDRELLIKSFKEGYRVSPSPITDQEVLYGSEVNIANTIKSKLSKIWKSAAESNAYKNLHFSNFLEKSTKKWFRITSSQRITLKVHYSTGIQEFKSVPFDFTFNDPNITTEMLEKGPLDNTWRQETDGSAFDYFRNYYYFDHPGKDLNGKEFGLIELYPEDSKSGKGIADVDFNQQSFENIYNTKFDLFSDLKHKNKIYSSEVSKNITDWNSFTTQEVDDFYEIWFKEFAKKYLFKNISSNYLNEVNQPVNEYGVSKDFLYSVNGEQGEDYSFYESLYNYNTITKPKILAGESKIISDKNNPGNKLTVYKIREDFWATKEQVENYTFLFGNLDTRVMYTFLDEQDISSIDGLLLAPTEAEAKRKQFDYESAILLNRYFVYDVFGNFESSAESGADALKKMQSKIALTSKYLNKREIDSWNGQPRAFNDIVQDGVYTIYSINSESSNTKKIYFLNYEKALEAVIAGISHNGLSSTEEVIVYMYVYVDEYGVTKLFFYKNDQEISDIVNEILN